MLAGFFMRFTIRDVLLVMVIVGLAVGWWLDHRNLDRYRAAWVFHFGNNPTSYIEEWPPTLNRP